MTTATSKKKTAAPKEDAEALGSDVEIIAAEPDVVTLSSGSVVRISPMKTREIFKLLKIFTVGAGDLLTKISFNTEDSEVFSGQMIGLLINAIPEADNETIEFLQYMVTPVDVIDRPKTKEQRRHNEELIQELWDELENPEPEDTILLVSTIVKNEAPNMLALGKRLAAMFNLNLA